MIYVPPCITLAPTQFLGSLFMAPPDFPVTPSHPKHHHLGFHLPLVDDSLICHAIDHVSFLKTKCHKSF